MLVVEVLAPLGEADSGEAFAVEAGVVAAAQEAVAAEDEDGMEGWDHPHKVVVEVPRGCAGGAALRGGLEVGGADVGDGASELARGRVIFGAEVLDGVELLGVAPAGTPSEKTRTADLS